MGEAGGTLLTGFTKAAGQANNAGWFGNQPTGGVTIKKVGSTPINF